MRVLLINVAHCLKNEKNFYSYDTEVTREATCAKLGGDIFPLNVWGCIFHRSLLLKKESIMVRQTHIQLSAAGPRKCYPCLDRLLPRRQYLLHCGKLHVPIYKSVGLPTSKLWDSRLPFLYFCKRIISNFVYKVGSYSYFWIAPFQFPIKFDRTLYGFSIT
jgi:hypothetical protein